MKYNENGECLVEHHVKYKELHGVDETVWLTKGEHRKLHNRLRREGGCNVPVEELCKISTAACARTPKRKKQAKEYNEKHAEELKKYRKELYQNNKEEVGEARKKYYQKHSEEIKKQKAEYRLQNREKINARQNARYHRIKEENNNE